MDMPIWLWKLVQSLINGLLAGGVYALVSVGITIVYGVMKMVNFAMGEFLMLGMYVTWVGYNITGWNNYMQFALVIVVMALIAYITFKLCFRPLLGKDNTSFILVTVGLSYFLMNLAQLIFSANSQTVPSSIKSTALALGEFSVGLPRLIAFVVAIVLVLIVNFIMNKTLVGRAMRATAENTQVAQMLGINSIMMYTLAIVISIVLAGLAGMLVTPIYYVNPQAGTILKTTALMIVVLGGLGDIKGAMIGGLMVGVMEAIFATMLAPELGPAGIFILFLLVLYLRPQGLFGKGARIA